MENQDKPARLETPFNRGCPWYTEPTTSCAVPCLKAVAPGRRGSVYVCVCVCVCVWQDQETLLIMPWSMNGWKLSFANFTRVHFPFHAIPFSTLVFRGA